MLRLHSLYTLALLAVASGCAGVRPQGALSPVGTRVTNEVIAEDALTFDAWAHRVAAVKQASGPRGDGRAYAAARAGAWLTYARESYAWDPRDAVADIALDETRRIVVALERDSVPALAALPIALDERARPDLWLALERARGGTAVAADPAAFAGAEVALVRASRLAAPMRTSAQGVRQMTATERACELELQVATAERLIGGMAVAAPQLAATPSAPFDVVLSGAGATPDSAVSHSTLAAGAPITPVPALGLVAPKLAPPAGARRPVRRLVHFALGSSELALASRTTLAEVVSMLRANPKVNVRIEGYTDARGNERFNRELAMRRALAVHRFLDRSMLDLGEVVIGAPRISVTEPRSTTIEGFARERRVTINFTGPNNEPLTLAAYQALDVDHERDLQIEQERRERARAARPSPSGRTRRSKTPR